MYSLGINGNESPSFFPNRPTRNVVVVRKSYVDTGGVHILKKATKKYSPQRPINLDDRLDVRKAETLPEGKFHGTLSETERSPRLQNQPTAHYKEKVGITSRRRSHERTIS